jgi:hypothetical protein
LSKDKKDFFGTSGLGRVSFGVKNIISLLDVAYVGGAVSQMNFDILKQEYQNLADLITSQMTENSLIKYISDETINYLSEGGEDRKLESRLSEIPINSFRNNPAPKGSVRKTYLLNKDFIGQKDTRKDTVNDLYGLNSNNEKKSLRKEQIINFLKDKTWTGIIEISKSLPDCGPKTVQRELLEMVSRNILKKQGERRWSKYMLV